MKFELSEVLRTGDVAIAALSEQEIASGGRKARFGLFGRRRVEAIWFRGVKRPVAVLIRQVGATVIFSPDGAPYPAALFDQRHPGVRAAFERSADETA